MLSAAPSRFCRGSNWQGGLGAGTGQLSLGFVGTVLNPHGCMGEIIHLSHPANASLSHSYRGLSHLPLCGRGRLSRCLQKPLRPLLAAGVGLQHGECLPENLELPLVPEIREGSTGARTQLLKKKDNNVDGDWKGREKKERKGERRGRGAEERLLSASTSCPDLAPRVDPSQPPTAGK